MELTVLCDFDGTITTIDTAEFTLNKFAKGDWRSIDRMFENGKISLEECLRREFKLVTALPSEIVAESEKVVDFRPHFEQLVAYCRKNCASLIVVSAGLDFLIDHFLRLKGWKQLVTTYTAKTMYSSKGIAFTFPRLYDSTSANFKQDLGRQLKAKAKRIAYIGDGSGDYDAAKEADYLFAVKGSRLAKLCEQNRILCTKFVDFREVVHRLKTEEKSYGKRLARAGLSQQSL